MLTLSSRGFSRSSVSVRPLACSLISSILRRWASSVVSSAQSSSSSSLSCNDENHIQHQHFSSPLLVRLRVELISKKLLPQHQGHLCHYGSRPLHHLSRSLCPSFGSSFPSLFSQIHCHSLPQQNQREEVNRKGTYTLTQAKMQIPRN